MQPRAAGLAAELKERLGVGEVAVEAGQQKSEFAVYVDEVRVFSRLEQGRFPEPGELVETITHRGTGAVE
jgi:selT/selW/selH-like putative selenoprotein